MRRPIWDIAGATLFLLAIFAAWQLIAQFKLVSPVFFPEPTRVADSIWRQVVQGTIWEPFASTCARMITGWALGVATGVVVGALIGLSSTASQYLAPSLEFLRTLPASAVLPIFILVMGLTNEMIVAIIAFGSLWPVLLSTIHAFRTLEPRLLEVASNLELGRLHSFFKITLPNAMPDILAGAKVSIGFALILAIVAEMLSSKAGLGNNILIAARSFRSADLFAGIVMLGLLGALTSSLLGAAERWFLRWRLDPDQT
jgi:sulfonate transport system permease protein